MNPSVTQSSDYSTLHMKRPQPASLATCTTEFRKEFLLFGSNGRIKGSVLHHGPKVVGNLKIGVLVGIHTEST